MFEQPLGVVLACVVSLGFGCETSSIDLIIGVRTDLAPGVEFDAVRVEVEGQPTEERTVAPGDDFIGGRRAAELNDLSPGTYRATVTLLFEGAAVISRPLAIDAQQTTAVTVIVTRDCRGVACPGAGDPSATACLNGRCVQPECTEENPSACLAAGCATAADCAPATASCAVARCVATACLYEDDGSCGGARYCEVETGCAALPMQMDAGGLDAGAVDSGADAGAPGLSALHDTFDGTSLSPSWRVRQPAGLDIDVSGGELTIAPTDTDWWFSGDSASLIYVTVSGDFAVTARIRVRRQSAPTLPPVPTFQFGGLMLRDPLSDMATETENYVVLLVGANGTELVVENKSTDDDASAIETVSYAGDLPSWTPADAELRICRVGAVFQMIARDLTGGPWIQASTADRVRPDLPASLQVGVTVEARPVIDVQAHFEEIRFTEIGSLAECMTLP